MIPFAIFDLMVPIGAGISTFWKRLPGSHRARSHRALYMIIYELNYIIINSEVNAFLHTHFLIGMSQQE